MNSSKNEHTDKLEASEKRVTKLDERIRIFDSSLKERVESAVETVTNKPENAMDTGQHPPRILTNWAHGVSRAAVGGANQVKERMPREQTEVLNNVFFEQQEREKRKSNLIIFGLKISENTLASNLSDESVRVGEMFKINRYRRSFDLIGKKI